MSYAEPSSDDKATGLGQLDPTAFAFVPRSHVQPSQNSQDHQAIHPSSRDHFSQGTPNQRPPSAHRAAMPHRPPFPPHRYPPPPLASQHHSMPGQYMGQQFYPPSRHGGGGFVEYQAGMQQFGAPPSAVPYMGAAQNFVPPQQPQQQQQPDEFSEIRTVLTDGGPQFGVSTVAFDGQEELIWSGNMGGHVTSYYGLQMQKYTSFAVHSNSDIRQILTYENKILSLCRDQLRCSTKFGPTQFDFRHENVVDMQCMMFNGPSSVLMGGHQSHLLELDLETQKPKRIVEVSDTGCAIFRVANNYICSGDTSGKISLIDPVSLRAEHTLEAHSGTLSDFDVHNNLLFSCGFSASQMGALNVDRFLMVYDLRMVRSMTPMPVVIEPMFVRFVPTYSDRFIVVSQTGQFQLLDQGGISSPSSMIMYQVQTGGAAVTSFDISTSCQAMFFGDTGGYAHLFTNGPNAVYNTYSVETEFATTDPIAPISINDVLTPYSTIPMAYPTSEKLFSDLPDEWCKREYRKPQVISPEILQNVRMVNNVCYAPNSMRRRRAPGPGSQNSPRFRYPQGNNSINQKNKEKRSVIAVPKKYFRVEMKYSKFGIEEFDFRHYNKTNFAGLETHIPNVYCNAMLQVLYFIEPFRCRLLCHLCDKEFCLACELGFLCHMLDQQRGRTCQASNFLRAFRTIPEASALGLVLGEAEETLRKVNLPQLIQSWNRFILQQVHSELVDSENSQNLAKKDSSDADAPEKIPLQNPPATKASSPSTSDTGESKVKSSQEENEDDLKIATGSKSDDSVNVPNELSKKSQSSGSASNKIEAMDSIVSKLFMSTITSTYKCQCGAETSRRQRASQFDLQYPQNPTNSEYPFGVVLQMSMNREQNTQAWCDKCEKFLQHTQTAKVEQLPDVIVVNCNLESSENQEFWKMQEQLVKAKLNPSPMEPQFPGYSSNLKMCRYGAACTRSNCRFLHDTPSLDTSTPQRTADPDSDYDEDASSPGWLPFGLKIRSSADFLEVIDVGENETLSGSDYSAGYVQYDLLASLAYVKHEKNGGNLVSAVHVGEKFHQRKEHVTCTQWYLFNDFSVTPVEKYEAVSFDLNWKLPCIIYYQRRDVDQRHSLKVENPVTQYFLQQDASLVTPRRRLVTFTPLDDSEMPVKGDAVGLDAEFVTLNQEESEIRSDGTRSTIKPPQMSVARVTCLRGKGLLEGEPFIDDYISTQEQVVDYLTQFSGIKPGDLDASISSKHLTTLKSTYLKLRYLIDVGVIFIGHGLRKDFRVLNLVVPKEQIVDTVDLFYIQRQRMISLKFLAWYFLDDSIQSVTHDSTEDARTALKLYKKYQQLTVDGKDKFKTVLKDLYEHGRKLQWKVPDFPVTQLESHLEKLTLT